MKDNSFTSKDSLALKGIAILMLMFHHCFMDAARLEGYEISFFPFTQELVIDVSYMFKICVSFFAFISGYGLYLSAKSKCTDVKSTEKWIVSRIFKTLGGFWFVYVLVFISTQLYNGYPGKIYMGDGLLRAVAYSITDFFGIANLMGTPSLILTWWYIGAAVIYVVVVPFIKSGMDKFGTVAMGILIFIIPRTIGNGFTGGTKPYAFLFTVFLGMVFARHDLFQKVDDIMLGKSKRVSEVLKFVVLALLLVIGFHWYVGLPMSKFWEYQYGLYAVLAIIFAKKYIARIPGLRDALIYFGKHSMNVFLIHSFIRYVFLKDFIYSQGHFVVIALVLYFISLAISVLIIEPLKNLLRYDKGIECLIEKINNKIG